MFNYDDSNSISSDLNIYREALCFISKLDYMLLCVMCQRKCSHHST